MPEEVILVDSRNRAIGRADKQAAHRAGMLHRAFSIFLVDAQGQVLLQQRHPAKYHSGGLWANSCCGHPRPGERTAQAARRRLIEELGVRTPLSFGFQARYFTTFPNGLAENEFVHVMFGLATAEVSLNHGEITEVAWMDLDRLRRDAGMHPGRHAFWLRFYLTHHFSALQYNVAAILRRGGGDRPIVRSPKRAVTASPF